jgi:hypothetical protein
MSGTSELADVFGQPKLNVAERERCFGTHSQMKCLPELSICQIGSVADGML